MISIKKMISGTENCQFDYTTEKKTLSCSGKANKFILKKYFLGDFADFSEIILPLLFQMSKALCFWSFQKFASVTISQLEEHL